MITNPEFNRSVILIATGQVIGTISHNTCPCGCIRVRLIDGGTWFYNAQDLEYATITDKELRQQHALKFL